MNLQVTIIEDKVDEAGTVRARQCDYVEKTFEQNVATEPRDTLVG
jgi:hypothetical protein